MILQTMILQIKPDDKADDNSKNNKPCYINYIFIRNKPIIKVEINYYIYLV